MEFWQQQCNTKLGLGTTDSALDGDQKPCLQQQSEQALSYHHLPNSPVQLDLLPLNPVPLNCAAPESPSTPQLSWHQNSQNGERVIDVNKLPFEEAAVSSPNSTLSTFQLDTNTFDSRGWWKTSEEDEGGPSARKKLRLSKEQSALLEESFREHPTLNPKQKLALAKRLNLSHRQVEVWFQNRRARTKLKQTEVDCEFLKRCCDNLTDENRRLKKELHELRALKMPPSPYYMGIPPATLTMCPSCERLVTTHNSNSNSNSNNNTAGKAALNLRP